MSRWTTLLGIHIGLLVLASMSFTAITGLKDGHYTWEYLKYVRQTGWGVDYGFPYSLPVVLTYLGAYGTGLATYMIAWKTGSRAVAMAGMLLCALGLLSFLFELTHWLRDHYNAWIISFPAVLLLLAMVAFAEQYRFNANR